MTMTNADIELLASGILEGDRKSLSQGITLMESSLPSHAESSELLLSQVLPPADSSLRIAVTGAPGVGKSSLIETLGIQLVEAGHKVAVLSIDPSSPRTGGSILGDKTRMVRLSAHANAFIRPSPSGHSLGGITHSTRSAMLLCEAAGYDLVLIETVGTGQSDYAVAQIVDVILLLVHSHAGDELQGIKRGILEMADLIAVTKSDGIMQEKAAHAAKTYRRALAMSSQASKIVPVLTVSAQENMGITDLWDSIETLVHHDRSEGLFESRRQKQIEHAIVDMAKTLLLNEFNHSTCVTESIEELTSQVLSTKCSVHHAARSLVHQFIHHHSNPHHLS